MGANEQVIFQVKQHPIGILGIYVSFGILLILVALGVALAPSVLGDANQDAVRNIGLIVFFAAAIFSGIFSYIAHIVYYGNRWILTSDSLTQVRQQSLFDKTSSQLSLGNLEDITARQDGIMAHIFNYGVLRVETAGERSKFTLPYCPNPNAYAQQILQAREQFEQGEGYRGRAAAAPTVSPAPNVPTQQAPQQQTPPTPPSQPAA